MTAQPLPLEGLPSASVDDQTAALLGLIASDRIHARDVETICRAVVAEAHSNRGVVDPNRLRARLSDSNGHTIVYPAVIGATIHALARRRVLVSAGWTVTEGSTSGNNGKPARRYRLVHQSTGAGE